MEAEVRNPDQSKAREAAESPHVCAGTLLGQGGTQVDLDWWQEPMAGTGGVAQRLRAHLDFAEDTG